MVFPIRHAAPVAVAAEPLTGNALVGLGLVVLAGGAGGLLARRLNLPTVVGFLAAGVLLGPVAGLARLDPALDALPEFGIALLLFLVGLDLSVEEARTVGPPALAAGLAQLAASALGGYALARLLGFDAGTSLFLAVALAFSSTVLVVKALVDLGELSNPHGRLAVGILLVQDLVVVLVLTLLPVVGSARDVSLGRLGTEAALALARTAVVVAGALLAARVALPPVLRRAAGSGSALLLTGLAWLFSLLAAAVYLHVSVEAAAFAAGLGLAATPFASDLRRGVHPLLDLFIALFFVSLGLGFDMSRAPGLLPGALAFTAFVIVSKGLVLALGLGLLRYPRRTSVRTGLTMGQVSEFSFVLAAVALGAGLLDPVARDFVILVGMVSMAASAPLIWRSGDVQRAIDSWPLARRLPGGDRDMRAREEPPEGHALLLGWDSLGAAMARTMRDRGLQVVALDSHPHLAGGLPHGVKGLYGSPEDREAVDRAGLARARVVVANLREPGLARVTVSRASGGVPGAPGRVPVVARAETTEVARLLEAEGAAAVLAPTDLVAAEVLKRLEEEGATRGGS